MLPDGLIVVYSIIFLKSSVNNKAAAFDSISLMQRE